jgi:hypothetical protein
MTGHLMRRDTEEEMDGVGLGRRAGATGHSTLLCIPSLPAMLRLLIPATLIPSSDHLRLRHKETMLLVVGAIPRR